MILLRAPLIVITAWVGWIILDERFVLYEGPIRANRVIDGDPF